MPGPAAQADTIASGEPAAYAPTVVSDGSPTHERWLATADAEATPSIRRRVVALIAEAARLDGRSPLRTEDGATTLDVRGSVYLLRDGTRPGDGRHNRVVGFGIDAGDARDLEAWRSHYEPHGIPCQVDVPASAWNGPVERAFQTGGFEFAGASFTAFTDPRDLPAGEPGPVEVEELCAETLDTAFELLVRGGGRRGFEASVRDERARELRIGCHRVYVAKLDGIPRAVASSTWVNDAVYLAHAFTEPEFRGRGCQSALLSRRIQAAASEGATLVVTDTLFDGPSRRNVERAGMRVAFSPGWWVRTLARRS